MWPFRSIGRSVRDGTLFFFDPGENSLVETAPDIRARNKQEKNMAADGFLKLDGVKGESRDAKHPGEIQILDVQWNLHQ